MKIRYGFNYRKFKMQARKLYPYLAMIFLFAMFAIVGTMEAGL